MINQYFHWLIIIIQHLQVKRLFLNVKQLHGQLKLIILQH